jgi:ankyrin repeat protein
VHCPIYPIAQQQDPVDFDTMESAWIHAAVYGLTDVISHFVAHGAHMDSLDWYHYKKEMTALMVACKYDHIDLVQFLLSNGANDAITDDEGKMALDYTDNPKIIELLLMHDMHKVAGMRNEDTHGESDEDQNGLIWGTLEPVVSEELSTDSDSADELKPSAARGIG